MGLETLQLLWKDAALSNEYIEKLLCILPGREIETQNESRLSQISRVPGICCQAAGGQTDWAQEVTASWFLLYLAAHLMDQVEDGDSPDDQTAGLSNGSRLNVASGLFFSATLLLNELFRPGAPCSKETAYRIAQDFYQGGLLTCDGQQLDLQTAIPTLAQYDDIVARKSGAFFALACRAGARLGTDDESVIEAFSNYGTQLGHLIQILDDIEDIQKVARQQEPLDLSKTIPIVYALEVASDTEREKLLESLRQRSPQSIALAESCGAALFIATKYTQHRIIAERSLRMTRAPQEYQDRLMACIPPIFPK